MLLGSKVFGPGKLGYGLGNEGKGRAQIMRHIGKKYQFGLRGCLKLLIKLRLLVPFLLKELILRHQLLLVPAALPVSPEQQESDSEKEDNNGNTGIEK